MHLAPSTATRARSVAILNGVFYANPPQRPIIWDKYEQIAGGLPLEWAIPTQQGDSYNGHPVLATLPDFFTKFTPNEDEPWKLKEGRFIRNRGGPSRRAPTRARTIPTPTPTRSSSDRKPPKTPA